MGHAFMNRYTDFTKQKRKGVSAVLAPCMPDGMMASRGVTLLPDHHTSKLHMKRALLSLCSAEMGLPEPADLESIQDTAWQRTLDFFAKYLK